MDPDDAVGELLECLGVDHSEDEEEPEDTEGDTD